MAHLIVEYARTLEKLPGPFLLLELVDLRKPGVAAGRAGREVRGSRACALVLVQKNIPLQKRGYMNSRQRGNQLWGRASIASTYTPHPHSDLFCVALFLNTASRSRPTNACVADPSIRNTDGAN
jgi:hypothetical protein